MYSTMENKVGKDYNGLVISKKIEVTFRLKWRLLIKLKESREILEGREWWS